MNKGIAVATGDFIGIPMPMMLSQWCAGGSGSAFGETSAKALYGDLDYVAADGTGRVVRRWRSGEKGPRSFSQGWMPPHQTLFLAGPCTPSMACILELRSAADSN